MKRALFLLKLSVLSVVVRGGNVCNVPHSKNQIDWDKIPRNWYLAFDNGDPITSDLECKTALDMKLTTTGYKFTAKYFVNGKKEGEVEVTKYLQPNGNYNNLFPNGKYVYNRNGKLNNEAVIEENRLNSREGETFHLTDNESYFFHISCDEKGGYIIWAFTATPNPDVPTIISAINALSDFGIRPKFKLSGCSDKLIDFTK
uniref:uncharacterized protein LOC120339154 n=1 Tax=Styela clava TaxID=7725 RepID=UPI00193A5FDF|nr:uncharacterized protein LOC120339154 [Styela clava]